jgi:hypothetical protein
MVSKKTTPSRSKKSEPSAPKPAQSAKNAAIHSKRANANNTEGGGESEEEHKSGASRPDEMQADVLEFIQAIDEYKRIHRRPFPSWSEVLEVLKTLGYQRAA